MSPSDQLSSPMDSSLSHLQCQQVTTVSLFQLSWVYKQATLDPVHSVSPLLLPQQQLFLSKSSPHHCLLLLDVPCPAENISFLRFLSLIPRGRKSLLRKSACSVPEAPGVPTKRPQVATSQVHPVPAFIATSSRPCGAVSCSCEPELPSGTMSPGWDWTPLWHGYHSSIWCKSLLLRARSCHLVPLYWINFVLLFITVLSSLNFLIPH